jgi:tRNA threonylcarbamoyladenosine biosynthesis protein TsaE
VKKLIREWKKVFEEDLSYIVFELKETLQKPALVIMEGDLGAGKTTFCKQFVGEAGTLSPTYSVISETDKVLHADFYRIKSSEEFYHLELELYLDGKDYFFAEWGEKHLSSLERIVGENYHGYLLLITVNESIADKLNQPSRNFQLFQIDLLS